MFFIRFLRWLLGWVRLETEGGFPEKLLNGAAKAGFSLWNSCRQGVRMTTCCYARQYKKLRPLAKKACVRMRVLERHGLPFFLHRYRARAGIAAGVLIYALLLQFLSGRIWIVNIEGNDQVPEASIREVLEPLGVQEGGDFRKLDVPSLQLTALQSLPDLTWLAVNLEGSTVHVKVRERGSHAPMEDGAFPSNIKAARDGRVLKIEVTGGQAMVQAGDAVTRDTLLISGVVESKTGPLLRRSSGRVIAETSRTLTAEVPLEETLLLPTGDSIFRPVFTLFGIRVPLFPKITYSRPIGTCSPPTARSCPSALSATATPCLSLPRSAGRRRRPPRWPPRCWMSGSGPNWGGPKSPRPAGTGGWKTGSISSPAPTPASRTSG